MKDESGEIITKKEIIYVPRGCLILEAHGKCRCTNKCIDLIPEDHEDIKKIADSKRL